jgi:hypothetical protein
LQQVASIISSDLSLRVPIKSGRSNLSKFGRRGSIPCWNKVTREMPPLHNLDIFALRIWIFHF